MTIGWKAQRPGCSSLDAGVVLVKYPRAAIDKHSGVVVRDKLKGDLKAKCEEAIKAALADARELADQALERLQRAL